ncbi:MAG: Asp-tRNA(Asn)/Glu-tRNA(Gln) amidotransferase subunit GatC [Fimbriimonadaceae bacterium]|nr:Asp-tRNA(Asn)/Glu-tRNA(Gln) amidotransferase subunit GatC [Fimbriimonadaceae bacterium]QYK55950.1 MAG: Asp-tRNA(Asn)/Glu-tRNA(Gln) amidotransferase subunit GatC [Fimbriimonadaceae bacterium]
MSISLDEVRHVARLARLELDEKELMAFQGELNALLGHFQDIQHIDVSNAEPKPHAVSLRNVWADDVAAPGLSRTDALSNAAVSRAGLFIVPTIIEE